MKRLLDGSTDGAAGRAGHKLLREMALNPRRAGLGQDQLREQLSRVADAFLGHDAVPPAKARIQGQDPKGLTGASRSYLGSTLDWIPWSTNQNVGGTTLSYILSKLRY